MCNATLLLAIVQPRLYKLVGTWKNIRIIEVAYQTYACVNIATAFVGSALGLALTGYLGDDDTIKAVSSSL